MAENNKTYRIKTNVGREADTFLNVKLEQDYDSLEILSLKLSDKDTYKLHNSNYGVVVGRVLANGNFGVPNAKISVFITADEQNSDLKMWNLYPYTSTSIKNDDDIRYNLLPDESVKDCHKAVGTFPHKTYLLENDAYLEVFDKYYVYTTRTNASGDYLICGVPTGMQTLHMDLDLSDCGILSQRPRDFVYKGYTIEQFENPNQFKKDENLDSLSQIFSQNQPVYVKPFWGNEGNGDEIGITRADIEISFKFEPTCVFMGSAISDNASNGVGKKCVPTNQMGAMDELTAGEGTIEMIRKTPAGNVEEFSIKGNQLINGNGVWCYQIPMNLDYMMTDEYGNMVPTDDPEKGIPTRTRVRFRASLTDMEGSSQSYYRAKYLIPNNPEIEENKVDYNFGTYTDESSYRDLFWNGVYTVKSYIPRFQKSKRWKSERFSGIKACNYYGGNNPMPYNNLRIRLPFMFTVLCIFVKLFIKVVSIINRIEAGLIRSVSGAIEAVAFPIKLLGYSLYTTGILAIAGKKLVDGVNSLEEKITKKIMNSYALHCTFIGDGLCPDMEGWYYAPGCGKGLKNEDLKVSLMNNTLAAAMGNGEAPAEVDSDAKDLMTSTDYTDETSTDVQNTAKSEEDSVCLTTDVDYLVNCFEMNLAQEYRVIKFDFYNDWVNGVIYFPRWMRKVKRKKKYRFSLQDGITTYYKDKVKGCMNSENSNVKKSRYYTQQCSLTYSGTSNTPYTGITTSPSCYDTPKLAQKLGVSNQGEAVNLIPSKCHKSQGIDKSSIFGKKSGLVTEESTMLGQYVYYLKPCEWKDTTGGKVRTLLFATDIVLLGTLNDCDENGIPQAFKYLNNSSYIMPTNLALTTMDDDSYIYSSPSGTVCSSTIVPNGSGNTYDNILRITPNYESTYSAYSKTDGDKVIYDEEDDPIPVTEAAGITWNYSGPGQDDVKAGLLENPNGLVSRLFGVGNKRYKYLYYPGGHFLGLSCVNSDTNIKSCVNLKRICELGATMSQRREELRTYNDANGKPEYRYYVPTGLISNVDIEGASFRSMFATLNHNKLIATETNENTGYKQYKFTFLRPDGFDGILSNYVQLEGSPYNKKVNDNPNEPAVTDATSFFENLNKLIGTMWTQPIDYDPKEVEYTERRTVEDTITDYYMFRLGLNTLNDKEQKKHYLINNGVNHKLPQYENSFYFYFGLKDGSTALDEFKKQFFSECEPNNVMKSPNIAVIEKIDENLFGRATLVINNMIGPYNIVINDNTIGYEVTIQKNSDTVNLGNYIDIVIGHEYTVIVTDSIDRAVTKTFVFGSSAVKVDVETVHFRFNIDNGSTQNDPRKGGYIKINDSIQILKKKFSVSDTAVTFIFKQVIDDTEIELSVDETTYTDTEGELWHLYYLYRKGKYNVYLQYNENTVSVYTTTVEDNSKINIFVSCDYLGYKAEPNPEGGFYPSYGLSALTENDWYNESSPWNGTSWEDWLMRHSYYRQTEDDKLGYDNYIYTKGQNEIVIFGQPEKGSLTGTGQSMATVMKDGSTNVSFYMGDYDKYQGYSIDDKYSIIPTKYWTGGTETTAQTINRNTFDAMAYSEDGRAAADASDIRITSYTYSDGVLTLGYTGSTPNGFSDGHGCIVVFENGAIIFPIVSSSSLIAYNTDVYPNNTATSEILGMATVYPTMRVPSFYKPFYGNITGLVWDVQNINVLSNGNGAPSASKNILPTSYKIEGTITNGLTYDNYFYSGVTTGNYSTYLNFKGSGSFYNALTGVTADDCEPKRELSFGQNSVDSGYYRQITGESQDLEELQITEIKYQVVEGVPNVPSNLTNVLTERYSDGFDLGTIVDSCELTSSFYNNIKIKVLDETRGLNGPCMLYSDESDIPAATELRVNSTDIFTNSTITVAGDGSACCYGYYNENAEYDTKGAEANVVPVQGGKFLASFSNTAGVKVRQIVDDESDLYDKGITLLHRYVLPTSGPRNVSDISWVPGFFEDSLTGVTLAKKSSSGTQFMNASEFNTIIAKYEKPYDGTKNKMTIYKLYAAGSLDVIFPVQVDGSDPFINTPEDGGVYAKEPQNASIIVSSNIAYKISSISYVEQGETGWLNGIVVGRQYDPSNTSIPFSLNENTGDDTIDRHVMVTITAVDSSFPVKYNGSTASTSITVTITQTKDDVTPVETTANSALSSANNANSRIDDVNDEISNINGDINSINDQIHDLWEAIDNPDNGGE